MSQSTYRAQLRAAVRGLWAGVLDSAQFSDSMFSAIRRFLTQAWHEGAAKCGLQPGDLTPEELIALEQVIVAEFGYVPGFAAAIIEGDKASGGSVGPLLARAELWANRYAEVAIQAELMACKDQKMIWRLGAVKTEHCSDCLRLDGKVKRASVWEKAGLHPKAYKLQCGPGRACKCTLTKTTLPITPGPLPRIAESAVLLLSKSMEATRLKTIFDFQIAKV